MWKGDEGKKKEVEKAPLSTSSSEGGEGELVSQISSFSCGSSGQLPINEDQCPGGCGQSNGALHGGANGEKSFLGRGGGGFATTSSTIPMVGGKARQEKSDGGRQKVLFNSGGVGGAGTLWGGVSYFSSRERRERGGERRGSSSFPPSPPICEKIVRSLGANPPRPENGIEFRFPFWFFQFVHGHQRGGGLPPGLQRPNLRPFPSTSPRTEPSGDSTTENLLWLGGGRRCSFGFFHPGTWHQSGGRSER